MTWLNFADSPGCFFLIVHATFARLSLAVLCLLRHALFLLILLSVVHGEEAEERVGLLILAAVGTLAGAGSNPAVAGHRARGPVAPGRRLWLFWKNQKQLDLRSKVTAADLKVKMSTTRRNIQHFRCSKPADQRF